MKIYSLLALAGAALGIQTSAQSKGVYINGLNGTLSSEYLQQVSENLGTVRRDALKVEKSEAERMIKYYKGVLNRSESELDKLPLIKPLPVKVGKPQKALMETGAKATASSYYNKDWMNPRLDAKRGFGNSKADFDNKVPQTWTTELAGNGSKKW